VIPSVLAISPVQSSAANGSCGLTSVIYTRDEGTVPCSGMLLAYFLVSAIGNSHVLYQKLATLALRHLCTHLQSQHASGIRFRSEPRTGHNDSTCSHATSSPSLIAAGESFSSLDSTRTLFRPARNCDSVSSLLSSAVSSSAIVCRLGVSASLAGLRRGSDSVAARLREVAFSCVGVAGTCTSIKLCASRIENATCTVTNEIL
jgi:hypothetical protein